MIQEWERGCADALARLYTLTDRKSFDAMFVELKASLAEWTDYLDDEST